MAMDGAASMTAHLVRVNRARACFGFVACSRCGVLECATYGAKMVGRTALSARTFLRSIRRELWSVVSSFPCPECSGGAGR